MPRNTLEKLIENAKTKKFFRIDDVFFTGIATEGLIDLIHYKGIRRGVGLLKFYFVFGEICLGLIGSGFISLGLI